MNKIIMKKILCVLLVISTLFSSCFSLLVSAHSNVSSAYLQDRGDADYHLKYNFGDRTTYIICSVVGHYLDGVWYPAYCVNKNLQGAETSPYDVAVTQVLDNNALWRVLVNGYPYKSAESMGLSEFDAFCVTKMAVYCILGQSDVNKYVADTKDTTAVHMLNKLRELVDIGLNGSETMQNGTLSSNKVGEFTQSGDFYYQEYSVNSGVEISEYSITNISGFGEGSYIANTSGGPQNTFGSTENFRIYVPKSTLVSDINGSIFISAKSKTYPILYGASNNPNLQDYVLTSDPYGDESIKVDLSILVGTGKIVINKTDNETKQPIQDVVFALYKDGIEIARSTTDRSGTAIFDSLYSGNYILKEIEANSNYIINNQELYVNVEYNETTTVDVTNEHKKGQIRVIKVDKDNNKVKLQGIKFNIYDENNNLVDTLETDKNGEAISKKLRINHKYTIQETKTLENYVLNDIPVTVELTKEQIENITFENELKKGQIRIIKVDKDFNEIKLKGVEFKIYDENNQLVDTLVTDENGEAVSKRLRIDKKYTIEETKTSQTYILNDKSKTVTLTQDQITDIKFENEHKKGNLKIYKVDKDNHKIALGNVKFDLYSEEFNKVIGTYTTNVDGEIKIDNLRIGNYKLLEKNTGKWYNLTDDTEVKIEWKQTTESMVENELQKGQIKVIKIDKDNHEVKLKGVKFDVLDEKGNVLETITTNENGEAFTSRYAIRDYEKLTLKEKETLENYVLNDKPQTVVLQANQIKDITFENEVKKGQIKVIKVDLDNNEVKLEGVKFEIKDEKGNIVDTITTDRNGEAITKRLPITSKYIAVETETNKEYVLTEKTQTVTLKQDEIKTLTFQNEKRKGQLKIIKVDLDDNEVLLEGVTFDILDKDGNIVDTVVTDKNGEATTKRLPCVDTKYTVVERETKKGYVLTEETQTIELKEDEITSIKFENEKIKGYLEITKIDSETKEKLADATFGIYDENNNEISQITTDENGKAKSELIPYGKYFVKELDTGSVYYLLNDKTFNFEITENHKIIPITIENEGVDIEVTVDKEGTTEIKPGEKVNYEFSNVGNASNIYLENFKWFDYIPTNYVRLEKMTTGTWNQDLTYDVYYKTNKSEEYILRYKDLKTIENHLLDFTDVELDEDEYIVETCFDFGKVDVEFKEDIKPTMECKSFDTLKENDTFTNYTKTLGTYFGITAEANSKWTTITHIPEEIHEVKLPKTGK